MLSIIYSISVNYGSRGFIKVLSLRNVEVLRFFQDNAIISAFNSITFRSQTHKESIIECVNLNKAVFAAPPPVMHLIFPLPSAHLSTGSICLKVFWCCHTILFLHHWRWDHASLCFHSWKNKSGILLSSLLLQLIISSFYTIFWRRSPAVTQIFAFCLLWFWCHLLGFPTANAPNLHHYTIFIIAGD